MTDAPSFVLPAAMRDEIVAHARQEAPRECCGIIAGADGRLTALHRMTNTYEGVDFYRIDDEELFKLYMELEGRGEEFAAIYHSHPVSVAYPSARDVQYAAWQDPVYLICSLEHPEAPVIRAFRIADETITELAIVAG
jgi:proteasome lid subunit RPN8/RPN11